MATTTRRAVLKAAPAIAVTASVPAALAAMPVEDPVLPIYRRWREAREEWMAKSEAGHDWEGADMQALEDAEYAALDELIAATPTTLAGIAALAHVFWVKQAVWAEGSPEREEEIQSDEFKLIASIWRGASGRTGLPAF